MDCKIIKYFLKIFLINSKVIAVEFQGKFIQGHYIIGKTSPGTKILIDKKKIKVSKDGFFVFGISKDRKYDIVITEGNKKTVKKIQKRNYKIQRIDGLPKKKLLPLKKSMKELKENRLIAKQEINSDLQFFKDKFIMPLDGAIITGVYGSQRILNGIPKWPHYGLDFAEKRNTNKSNE